MDRMTYLSLRQKEKKVAIGWKVKLGSHTYFEHRNYALCAHYIKIHGLNTTPKPIY